MQRQTAEDDDVTAAVWGRSLEHHVTDHLLAEDLSAFSCGYNHFLLSGTSFLLVVLLLTTTFCLLLQLIDCDCHRCQTRNL